MTATGIRCPVALSGVLAKGKELALRLQRVLAPHLPGGLKFDPPGSMCHRCFLLPKSSTCKAKRGGLLLKGVHMSLSK